MSPPQDVVLFDLLETLGSEVVASAAERLADFEVYPSARALLARLREHARLGVFVLDPDVPVGRLRELLSAKGVIPPIDPELVAVARGDDRSPFTRFLDGLRIRAERVVFVSLDARDRWRARDEGLRVAPHPALVAEVLKGEPLQLARFAARDSDQRPDWAALLNGIGAVPVFRTREREPVVYAMASRSQLASVPSVHAVRVEILGGPELVETTTLVLLQVTKKQADADTEVDAFLTTLRERGFPLARKTPRGWLVALPGDHSVDELHPPRTAAGHGHTRVLLPDPSVLKPPALRVELAEHPLDDKERSRLEELDAAAFSERLEAWFGPVS